MKNTLTLFILLFASFNAFSTHNIGGHITYKALSIYKYSITATIYTDARSIEADRPIMTINFGDGNSASVNRSSQTLINENVYENIYTTTHNYEKSGAGKYLINLNDANRIKEVINADQSVSETFYLESLLVIDVIECANSSARFTIPPLFKASLNGKIFQSLNLYDENGDSIIYELISPLKDSATKVNGYTIPKGIKISDGQLIWLPEKAAGRYLLAIKIWEYRNGKLMGYIVKEWITDLVHTTQPIAINTACSQPDSVVCKFDGKNGNNISFQLKIPGLNQADVTLEMFAPALNYRNNPPLFSVSQDSSGNIIGEFSWKPDTIDISEQALNFVFRATKNDASGIENHALVKIYADVSDQNPCYNIAAGINKHEEFKSYNVYPNPISQSATIKLDNYVPGIVCSVYNLQGQKVSEMNADNSIIKLDANNLSAGMYIFHISASQKILGKGKFVVQK